MIERDPKTLARLQAVVTALIEHRVATSLVDVERALAKGRSGAHSALAAHGAVLRHAARCERTVERVTAAAGDRPEGILRDAVDVGLMSVDEFVALVGKPPEEVASIDALRDEDEASAPDKRRTLEQLLGRGPVLVHIDAYRLRSLADLESIGWEVTGDELRRDAVVVVEWAERLSESLGDDLLSVRLTHAGEDRRELSLHATGSWLPRATPLAAALDRAM